jgi:two-component system OmpR family response regulator
MARILIVETNPFFADVLACTLWAEKHDVVVANSAEEGIRLGAASRPDVVVAAWLLRGELRGGDVCRRIRAASPGTKVIIITGRDELISQAKKYCRCVVAVLAKPFHREDILAAVRKALCGGAAVLSPPLLSADLPIVTLNTSLLSR